MTNRSGHHDRVSAEGTDPEPGLILAQPIAEGGEPCLIDVGCEREVQDVGERGRAFRGEIGEIHPQAPSARSYRRGRRGNARRGDHVGGDDEIAVRAAPTGGRHRPRRSKAPSPGKRTQEAVDDGELVGQHTRDSQPLAALLENSSGRRSRATRSSTPVHQPGLVGGEEGIGDVDIFGDDDASRDVALLQELEHAAAQDGAKRHVDARERPGRRQRAVDDRVYAPLLFHNAGRPSARKKVDVGGPQLLAFELRRRAGAPRTPRRRRAASRRRHPSDRAPAPRPSRAAPRWLAGLSLLGLVLAALAMRGPSFSLAARPSRKPRPPRPRPCFSR